MIVGCADVVDVGVERFDDMNDLFQNLIFQM